MTTGKLDRRSAAVLIGGVAFVLLLRFVVFTSKEPAVVAVADSAPLAEKHLARMRELIATVPGKDRVASQVAVALASREKGMLTADTAAQAEAQLLEIIRRTGKDAGIDVRGAEEMKVNPLAQDYGEALVSVSFTCRIEQLINFMADLANRPELLATSDIRISAGSAADKTVNVHLGLSGVVARKLVPAKKGPASS